MNKLQARLTLNFRPNRLILVALIALFTLPAHAQQMPREDVVDVPAIGEGLCVSNVFQTNMVLQRDKPIHVWGWAEPGEEVTVTFAGEQASAEAGKDRAWKVTLPAVPANGKPQQLTVKGNDKTLVLENILVGDVWVLGGQSNMEFPLANVENGSLEIISANFPEIRILSVPHDIGPQLKQGFARLHQWSDWSGRHFRKGDWDVCMPETVRELSAIGYVFASRVHKASKVPIGVIDASRGGSPVETWTPLPVLRAMGSEPTKAKLAKWDADIEIRAAQYQTFLDFYNVGDENIGFVSTYDFRRRSYHPQSKIPAGERIARWALATQYGFEKQVEWKPPMLLGMKQLDGALLLKLDTDVCDAEDGAIEGFAIAGEDRRFHPADVAYAEKGKDDRGRVQYDRKQLVLTSPMVSEPIHFRYAWGRNPLANLQATGNTDLPFGTQRSDDWNMEEVPLGVLDDEVTLPLSRGDKNKFIQALREQDEERRLKDAEQIIEANSDK